VAAGYADADEYLAGLAEVYRQELADLAARGASYVQIDDVPLAMLCDPDVRARLESNGESPDAHVERYVSLLNSCIGARPSGLTVGIHLCRGNFKGLWLSDGGYDYVARRLFNGIQADAFFLEFDTERAGGFEPLAAVPPDTIVVLGLVSTKTPAMETRDELMRRIDEAGRFLSVDNLALSPQCGFASTVGGNRVTEDDQFAKLRLIVEVATEVWGSAGAARESPDPPSGISS
jgi:5-methyltetrahydropteroyltriglutamate--homocysteine methyltransferase